MTGQPYPACPRLLSSVRAAIIAETMEQRLTVVAKALRPFDRGANLRQRERMRSSRSHSPRQAHPRAELRVTA